MKEDRKNLLQLVLSVSSGREINEHTMSHETSEAPPALSQNGTMHFGTKSEMIHCLKSLCTVVEEEPVCDCVILDGAYITQMLSPASAHTFADYSSGTFLPFIRMCAQKVKRLDIVWDIYTSESLKKEIRVKRGEGLRLKVTPKTKVPGNWQEFLRIDDNKTELFHDIRITGKTITTTRGTGVITFLSVDTTRISTCCQEEADTRMILHAFDAANNGLEKKLIRASDSDVVVLATAFVLKMPLKELWISHGGKHIPTREIARQLGADKSTTLPAIHVFTGCDVVSAFYGKGKKSA